MRNLLKALLLQIQKNIIKLKNCFYTNLSLIFFYKYFNKL